MQRQQPGLQYRIEENARNLFLNLLAPNAQPQLLLSDGAGPGNLGWFSCCQFHIEGCVQTVPHTAITVANQKDRSRHTLSHALRVQISKELQFSFRLPGKQPLTEQLCDAVLYNLLSAPVNTDAGVCAGPLKKLPAGRTATIGVRN